MRYIPKGYELIAKNERFGFEVYAQRAPRLVAMAFGGKRSKPDWHYLFKDEARLNAKIEETLRALMASDVAKAERKAERARSHDVKVGDIFRCSWGYDQTNIDYYEVTRVIGERMVEITPIAQEREETHYMQGECVPVPGKYTGDPQRKKVQMYSSGPSIRIASYSSASRIDPVAKIGDKPVYAASHWTAYA